MDELQTLSDVVGDIYDASLDAARWSAALRKTSGFVGVHSTTIISVDTQKHFQVLLDDNVIDPIYTRRYFETYVKLDPFVTLRFFVEPGEPVANTDLMSVEEIRRSRIYREWAQPQGLLDCITTTLEQTSTRTGLIAMLLHERDGFSNEEKKRRARLLIPHLRRALLIANALDHGRAAAETFEAALNGLSAGIFFVEPEGRIRHANTAGHRMLAGSGILRAAGGRLTSSDEHVASSLAAAFVAAAKGDAALGTHGISIPLTGSGEPHVAHILPLTGGARSQAGSAYAATAAIFVQKTAPNIVPPPVALSRAFGLTRAETRILVAIVEIGGVPAVAEALGLSTSTVKVHLKNIFAKTGAERQADLVKVVAGFSSPLAGAQVAP